MVGTGVKAWGLDVAEGGRLMSDIDSGAKVLVDWGLVLGGLWRAWSFRLRIGGRVILAGLSEGTVLAGGELLSRRPGLGAGAEAAAKND